jgi:hypothetical protein
VANFHGYNPTLLNRWSPLSTIADIVDLGSRIIVDLGNHIIVDLGSRIREVLSL